MRAFPPTVAYRCINLKMGNGRMKQAESKSLNPSDEAKSCHLDLMLYMEQNNRGIFQCHFQKVWRFLFLLC